VRVALAAGQDPQHQRAQHVAWSRRVGAAVAQRALLHPALEYAGSGQELGEEHDLSVRRGLGRLVPAHVHTAAHRVDDHRVLAGLRQHRPLRFVGFTHRVSVPNSPNPAPALKKTAVAHAPSSTGVRTLGTRATMTMRSMSSHTVSTRRYAPLVHLGRAAQRHAPNPKLAPTIMERAWSSAIWVEPAA